jgi:hypothetical protein
MNLRVLGPLIFWTLMFTIGTAIKIITFQDSTVWFQLAPQICLWASGILFTLAVSPQTYERTRVVKSITKDPSGRMLQVGWDVVAPDDISFIPAYVYLFLSGMVVWILTLLLSGLAGRQFAAAGAIDWGSASLLAISTFLSAGLVGITLYTLREVTQ